MHATIFPVLRAGLWRLNVGAGLAGLLIFACFPGLSGAVDTECLTGPWPYSSVPRCTVWSESTQNTWELMVYGSWFVQTSVADENGNPAQNSPYVTYVPKQYGQMIETVHYLEDGWSGDDYSVEATATLAGVDYQGQYYEATEWCGPVTGTFFED